MWKCGNIETYTEWEHVLTTWERTQRGNTPFITHPPFLPSILVSFSVSSLVHRTVPPVCSSAQPPSSCLSPPPFQQAYVYLASIRNPFLEVERSSLFPGTIPFQPLQKRRRSLSLSSTFLSLMLLWSHSTTGSCQGKHSIELHELMSCSSSFSSEVSSLRGSFRSP